jgi:hypothetical protein
MDGRDEGRKEGRRGVGESVFYSIGLIPSIYLRCGR